MCILLPYMNFSGNIPKENAEKMKNLEHGPHACFGAYGRPQQHKC